MAGVPAQTADVHATCCCWVCRMPRERACTVPLACFCLQFDALTKYGIDLTAKAAELDPVIG